MSSNITASGVLHNITVSDRTVSVELSARSDNSTHSAHGKAPLVPQQPLVFKVQGNYYITVDRHAVKIGEVASFSKAVEFLLMTFYVFNVSFPQDLKLLMASLSTYSYCH